MRLTNEQIDGLTDGELEAFTDAEVFQPGGWHVSLNGNGVLSVMEAAGRRGWEFTFIHRAAFGQESIAAVAYGFNSRAELASRHARPEIAVFRAFLYAVHARE